MVDSIKLNIPKPTKNSYRNIKILATAQFSNVKLEITEGFKFGIDNKTDEYLKKFPLGQIPTIEMKNGSTLAQSDAICLFIGSDEYLRKDCKFLNAKVMEYAFMASHEINQAQTTLCYPCLGLVQPDKNKSGIAKEKLIRYLSILNENLKNVTYLVGERITYADIAVACELLLPLSFIIEPTTLSSYPYLKRWFITIVNQPEMKKYIGDYEFCVKAKGFDAKLYNELHPKEVKAPIKKETKKDKAPVKKTETAPAPAPVKKKELFPNFESKFNLEDFKRVEANSDPKTVTIPYLWENLDTKNYSIWFSEYLYADEIRMGFLAKNFVRGTFDSLTCLNKHIFGLFYILGQTQPFKVQGIYIQKGQDLLFNLDHDSVFDSEIFSFKKLNLDSVDDKKLVETYLSKSDEINGLPVYDFHHLR